MRKIPDIAFPSQTSSFLSSFFRYYYEKKYKFYVSFYAPLYALPFFLFSPIYLMYYHHNFISHKIIIYQRQDVLLSLNVCILYVSSAAAAKEEKRDENVGAALITATHQFLMFIFPLPQFPLLYPPQSALCLSFFVIIQQ